MNILIKKIMGHYEVYGHNNEFLFSCDNEHELKEDLKLLSKSDKENDIC